MYKSILTTAAAGLIAAPAFAGNIAPAPAEAPVVAPAPAPVYSAGTDWTGAYGGAQLGWGFGDANDVDLEGVVGGVYGGYNYDFGQFVVGGELDFSLGNLEVDGSNDAIDQIARLKLRAGYDAGRTLIYGTAGGAYASGDVGGASASDFGWVLGAGVDVKVTDRVTAGVEYLYHKFDDFDGTGADITANTISARVGLSF